MKSIHSFVSAIQDNEIALTISQLNSLKGGNGNSSHDGEIIDRDKPIYIKE